MKVFLRFTPALAKLTSCSELALEMEAENVTVGDLLLEIERKYPIVHETIANDDQRLSSGIICIINGEMLNSRELETRMVNDEDTVSFTVAIAGG